MSFIDASIGRRQIQQMKRRLRLGCCLGGFLVLGVASPLPADQLVSVRNAAVKAPAGGNGDSVAPLISPDGRFVLFSSSADNLVAGDNSQLGLDLFLRDRSSNLTWLISANLSGTGGGNGNSLAGQVSTNGRYVVFQGDASDLLAGDTNAASDIFVRDRQLESNILVSVAADGGWANGASTDPVMTPDGRFVAFVSAATNLVANDTNGLPDVFVRDLLNGTTQLISVGATGTAAIVSAPVITPEGRYVAYASTAHGLVATIPATAKGEVYVRDLVLNTTTWASTNAANLVSNALNLSYAPSYHPAISDDGRFVTFKTGWTNGATAPGGTGVPAAYVFQFDSANRTTTTISTNSFAPWLQNDDVYGPETSPDGRFVVFVVTNQSAQCLTVQRWDAQAGTNLNVSVTAIGGLPAGTVSDRPAVSADGRYVVFMSTATSLTGNTLSNGFHAFRRDVQAGTTQLVDMDTNNVASADLVTAIPTMSADGRFVAFESLDGRMVNGDKNGAFDVFVRDLTGGSTEMISRRDSTLASQADDGLSLLAPGALSDDGQKLVFTSYADDLVPNDTNNAPDVFVADLTSGTNALVSVGVDGKPAAGSSFSPVLSNNGRFVAFVSSATNLIAGRNNPYANLFLRDLLAGTNAMVSVASDGVTAGNGDASLPAITQDGKYVVFVSRAGNLATGGSTTTANTYLRNLATGTTILLTNNASPSLTPSLSADGRYVAYFGSGQQLMVRDTLFGTNVFSTNSAAGAVLSPTGGRLLLLYNSGLNMRVINLTNKATLFTVAATKLIRYSAPWSTDCRFFTFVTATNAAANDVNGLNDVYLGDLQSGSLTLVSTSADHTGAGSGASDSPVIRGDGHFVAYRSQATNLVAGITNPPPNIFIFDRLTGSNQLLTTTAPGSTWFSAHGRPIINGDGHIVTFPSWNPNLAPGDLNRVQDVVALVQWGTVDSDGDGLPDLWMTHYFGHPTGLDNDFSLAQQDADGDGMSNLAEFLAGTNPTDATSVLRLQIQMSVANQGLLNWLAVPGKTYRMQFKENLDDAAWTEVPGATVNGNQGSFAFPADAAHRFYRVATD